MVTYLSLGSNLGDRENYLRIAAAWLDQHGIPILRSASVYQSEPRDYAPQPWFLNTIVQAETDLPPEALLQQCQAVEQEAGRVRTVLNGPRVLDVDIIFYGSIVHETPDLTIPHPRYASRRFVLAPLMEIAPDFVDPKRRRRIRELFNASADRATVEMHGPPLL